MNKFIIISYYTFQDAQVQDTRPRTVRSGLASLHSAGLVRDWKSAFMRQLYELPSCCDTMTLLALCISETGGGQYKNGWTFSLNTCNVENIKVAVACDMKKCSTWGC